MANRHASLLRQSSCDRTLIRVTIKRRPAAACGGSETAWRRPRARCLQTDASFLGAGGGVCGFKTLSSRSPASTSLAFASNDPT